jgi:hypothetical protein
MTPPAEIRARFVRAVELFGNRAAPGDPDLGGLGSCCGGVLSPRVFAGVQALVVAVQNATDGVGDQFTLGLLGFDVHGEGPLVVAGTTQRR